MFSKSGVFHIMAYCILHSTQISINWSVARPKYEIYVMKISVSPEERKMDFFKLSPRAKSVP